MRVEQAIFGEYRGGHALRAASGDKQLAAELSSRLDLPDTAPSGIDWSPFISGFPHGEHYVFARTFLDPAAPRAGMVFSHAIIAPLDVVIGQANLRPMFERLLTVPRHPENFDSFDVDMISDSPSYESPELVGTAEALTTKGSGPVVRPGVANFECLILAVWAHLWPEIRKTFSYRLSFGPNDIVEMPPPTLVCTPRALVTRWREHRIIDSNPREPSTMAAALLCGRSETHGMTTFAIDIGAKLKTFGELHLLEQAYRFGVVEPDTFGHTTAAVRLVDKLSPNPKRGRNGKERILGRLAEQVGAADASAILTVRNLTLDAFEPGHLFWVAIRNWVQENVYPPEQDRAFLSIIEDGTREAGAVPPWRSSVATGLRIASQIPEGAFAAAFWRWVELQPSILTSLLGCLDVGAGLEERLVKWAPQKLEIQAANATMEVAKQYHLLHLHAAAASMAYSGTEAVRMQLELEGEFRTDEGLTLALRNSQPEEVLANALEIGDTRLLELAGRAVAKNPRLLANTDMSHLSAQAVWRESISVNPEAWRGPKDPHSVFNLVLTNMLDGGPVDQNLITILSTTPLADLSSYPRRAEIWRIVTGTTRSRLLCATVESWIRESRTGTIPFEPDPELRSEILASRKLSDALEASAASDISLGIQIVAALDSFDEERFLRWIRDATDRISFIPVAESEALGRLILERGWRQVADELVSLLRGDREDVRPALRVCLSLISLFTRWSLKLSSLTSAEKWESFESAAAKLYPSGPDDNQLWERAGGDDADLPRNGDGRSRWHETLGKIERGWRGLKIERLLHEMQEDYPLNEQLRFFAGDYEFGGRR